MTQINGKFLAGTAMSLAMSVAGGVAFADQVIADDLIVQGSICVGLDCVNGESFGFNTLILKENNVRLKFDDTSTTSSFPNNDWELTANDSANGGANKFSITNVTGGRIPFTVEAGARTNALYVDSTSRIGIGTSSPSVNLHMVDGNTPTLRLEQNTSAGFAAQTFDIAANETNFFVRDVTNGSRLPFRIRPGAPTSSIDVGATGKIGMGTSTPDARLQILTADVGNNSNKGLLHVVNSSETTAVRHMAAFDNNGDLEVQLNNTAAGAPTPSWKIANLQGDFRIITPTTPGIEFSLSNTGNLTIMGNFISGATTLNVPDYVFDASYDLMPLSELEQFVLTNKHLPLVPSAATVREQGLNLSDMQMALLQKVEELTLYTFAQQASINHLQARLDTLTN